MVQKGRFRVQLIEAQEMTPFREHEHSDGKFYAEVEPGTEYFIQVEVLQGNSDEFVPVVTGYEVDGVFLDYMASWDKPGVFNEGHWEYDCKTKTATKGPLRFEKQGTVGVGSSVELGSVSVHFHKRADEGASNPQDEGTITSSAPSGPAGASKMVRSGKGSSSTIKWNEIGDFEHGGWIETITIHYGTVPGLIHAKVLAKPPLWEGARLHSPLVAGSIDPVIATLKPKIIQVPAVTNSDGRVMQAAKTMEEFDLSHLPETDDKGKDQVANLPSAETESALIVEEPEGKRRKAETN